MRGAENIRKTGRAGRKRVTLLNTREPLTKRERSLTSSSNQ